MSNTATLLPLVILALGILSLFFLKKGMQPMLYRLYKWRTNLIAAGCYLTVLFLVSLVVFFGQDGLIQAANNHSKGQISETPDDWREGRWQFGLPKDGSFEKQEGVYKNSSQTFKVDATETPPLKIRTVGNSGYEQIYMERKESADGIIEVNTYVAPHYAGTIDFTKIVAPPKISLEKGILQIEALSEQKLVFKTIGETFVVNQFKQKAQNTSAGRNGVMHGARKVLVRIPANLEIADEDREQITWVGDS